MSPLPEDVPAEDFVKLALEASFYLSALHPGLTKSELADVLIKLGAGPGEAGDTIDAFLRTSRGGLYRGTGRIFFSNDEVGPHELALSFGMPFEHDPRDPKACSFVQRLFKDTAAQLGIRETIIGYEEVIDAGTANGCDVRALEYGIELLRRTGTMKVEQTTTLYRPTDGVRTHVIFGEQPDVDHVHMRPNFGKVLPIVRSAIDSRYAHGALIDAIRLVSLPLSSEAHDETVLRFSVARFFDSRRVLQLGQIDRHFRGELNVASITQRLINDGWLFPASTSDPRSLLPSIRALALQPAWHADLLAVLDGFLRRAKELWGENKERTPLLGPAGLLDSTRAEEPLHKLALLLLPSLQPAIVVSDGSFRTVEIRRDVMSCGSLPEFLRYRIANDGAAEPTARVEDMNRKTKTVSSATDVDQARPVLYEQGWVLPRNATALAKGGGGAVYKCYRRSLVEAITRSRDGATDETLLAEEILAADPERSCAALKIAHRYDERLAREIAAMQSVHHDHLVQVFARDERPQPVWYLMEFIGGRTVHEGLAEFNGRAEKTLRAVLPIAKALAQLHRHPLVHRDVKTKNVFRRRNGSLVLGDLGIVFDPNAPRVTTYEAPMSKDWVPRWAPPDLDTPARDVYSLARVVYAMISGDKQLEPDWLQDAENQLATLFPDAPGMPAVDKLIRDHIVSRRGQCASQDGDAFASAVEETLRRITTGPQIQPLLTWGLGHVTAGSGENRSLNERPIMIPDWTRRLCARLRYRHSQQPEIHCNIDVALEDGTKVESERVFMKPHNWYDLNLAIPKRKSNDWCTFSLRSPHGALVSEFSLYALSY